MNKGIFHHILNPFLFVAVDYSKNRFNYFASRFYSTINGLGTSDLNLIRLVISRCETDLGDIKQEYERIYGASLSSAVSVLNLINYFI